MKSRLIQRLREQSVLSLTRIACWAALAGLAVMVFSVLFPGSLSVMLAMSAGHAIGGFAFLCYVISVVLDVTRRKARPSFVPAEAEPSRPSSASSE